MVLIGTEFVLGVENVTLHEISAQLFVSTSVPEFEIKLVLIGTEFVLGVNMKVVDNCVSFLMALV